MLLTLLSLALAAAPSALVLRNVQVVDLDTGSTQETTIVVEDGKIAAMAASPSIPSGARVVEPRGLLAVPGLFDMHVHLSWSRDSALPLLVANGVLAVRDLGGRLSELDSWHGAIASGARDVPHHHEREPSSLVDDSPQWLAFDGVVDLDEVDPDGLQSADRRPALVLRGHGQVVPSILLPVESGPSSEQPRPDAKAVTPAEAIAMGMAGMDHTETLFEGPFSKGKSPTEILLAVEAWAKKDAIAFGARLAASKVAFSPSLVAYRSRFTPPPQGSLPDIASSLRAEPTRALTDEQRAGLARMLQTFQKIVGAFHRQGVRLLAGTDLASAGGVPGESLHEELGLLVESGLSPLAALRAATIDPVRFLGVEADLGSVAPGKTADFLLVTGNPAKDIAALRTPQALVVRGQYLDRTAIDGLLSEARALASRR